VSRGGSLEEAFRLGIRTSGVALDDDDVLVVTHKLISRAEGATVRLSEVRPRARARWIARLTNRDARLVEVILQQTRRLVRVSRSVILTEHLLGHVSANAGVDRSNSGEDGVVCVLPSDPEGTARRLSALARDEYGKRVAVLVSDSHGRPFRRGTVGACIGICGFPALLDLRGQSDLFGYKLRSSVECVADELCAAANLMMGQADEGIPVVVVRGIKWHEPGASIQEVLRPASEDIFRRGVHAAKPESSP
jgi:coenzyme F420-0:L-glutamate ligase/coenzyme F420-1:gamma-L-glutamate ligase